MIPVVPKEEEQTTVKRDFTCIENLSLSSTSTLPVTDLASNIYDFKVANIPDEESLYKDIKYYEILNEYPFEIKKGKGNDGTEAIDILVESSLESVILIKDNKINARLVSAQIDNSKYILFYDPKSNS